MKQTFLLACLLACGSESMSGDSAVDADRTDADLGAIDLGSADRGSAGSTDTGLTDTGVSDGGSARRDIRNAVFGERSGDCAAYETSAMAQALDIQRMLDFTGLVDIEVEETHCDLSSNAIPNHDFNDEGARFATNVGELLTTWSIPRNPAMAPSTSPIELSSYDGVMLNGVVIDLLAAGCFGVGDGRIGCFDLATPYRYDPMSPSAGFGTDSHNAHTQPDGRYHYHGDPLALYGGPEAGASGVIGFAADGFPIFGPYFDDGVEVRAAQSGYSLREGLREGGPTEGGAFLPYDGTFVDDYEFTGGGDLDACNGMVVDGQYGYYLTATYPWVLACFRGTPDPSFNKRR